jgi:ubiquinone biosynthesis protein UbiJ
MKKVFRNALIAASVGAMLGGLSSCKDTDEDLKYEIETELTGKLNSLSELEALVAQLKADLAKIKSCECDNAALISKVDDLTKKVEKLDGVPQNIVDLQDDIDDLAKDLKDNYATKEELQKVADDLAELSKKIDLLEEKLAKLVTSVLIQGTYNPAFGTIALPLDLRSNVLCAYYGEAVSDVDFPSVQTSANVSNSAVFTKADIALLKEAGLEIVSIENGQALVDEAEGNAGKLYLTVNPTAVDFTGLNFSLVNSLDEESGITIGALTPSKDKLTFGYTATRGDASNGFYEAPATLTAENISKVKINVESSLKSAVKDVYQNKTNANFTNLASAIYKQFNGLMDANAVKAAWTTGEGDDAEANSVYSQYGIAAFAFSPLSYSFDPNFSANLPTIPDVPELGEFSFDLNLKVPEFNLDLSNMKINLDVNIDPESIANNIDLSNSSDVEATVEVSFSYQTPVMEYNEELGAYVVATNSDGSVQYKEETGTGEGKATVSLANFTNDLATEIGKAIATQLEEVVGNLNAQIQSQIIDQLANTIQDQVAVAMSDTLGGLMDNLNSQISDKIGSYLGTFNTYLNKLQSVVDQVNSIFERINSGISINALIRPTLIYDNGSKFGRVSTSLNNPTVFDITGGNNAITLHPTSLSAELIAPAYKKFVGVTNVYNSSDLSKTAQGGDAGCKAAAKTANSAEYMDEVLSGGRYGVGFVGTAGYTYEIAYAALDYHGQVSIQKFYVKVR